MVEKLIGLVVYEIMNHNMHKYTSLDQIFSQNNNLIHLKATIRLFFGEQVRGLSFDILAN